MDDKRRQAEAGAYALARRNVALAMTRQGRPVDENPLTYMPSNEQIAAAPAPAVAVTAPAAPTPTAPAVAVNPWQSVVDKVNGKPANDDPASAVSPVAAAWARAIEAANARRRDG